MPRYAFHQNTRNLSSSDFANISPYFRNSFRTIRQNMGAFYVVAGLTELKGEPRTLARQVPQLTQHLDLGLDEAVVIAIMQGSSARGRKEYIGIAYDDDYFTLEAAGSVWPLSTSSDWVCYNKPAANINRSVIDVPPTSLYYRLDYRGVAYIAGDIDGDPYIFCFIHNDYGGGNRSGTFRSLGIIAEKILAATNYDEDDTFVLIGGDFNVDPDDVSGRSIALRSRYELDNNNHAVPTTASNTYDFWMMNTNNIGFNRAFVHGETQNAAMSDHSGITLRF